MNFRRLPFQFTTVNPSERQEAIRKRFGLPNPSDMHLDFRNSSNMGAGNRESNSATSSPRLQHRVPVCVEDPDSWISEKSRSNNVDHGRKPNVRVVPIEIEGDRKPARVRTYSGPAGFQHNNGVGNESVENDIKPVKHSMQNMTLPNRKRVPSGEKKPRVYNIPVQIEKSENNNDCVKKPNLNSSPKDSKTNGCNNTKILVDKQPKSEEKPPEPDYKLQLKKIDNVLDELKLYEAGVGNFCGVANDKNYRYLDEMLTRLMLRLDDIETMGNPEVRSARKAAIKKVQSCIDLLETKINFKEKDVEMTEKEAESAIASEGKDLLDVNKDEHDEGESTIDEQQDLTESSDTAENRKVPEVEMKEADLTEVEKMEKCNGTVLADSSCSVGNTSSTDSKSTEMDVENPTESNGNFLVATDENPEVSHSIEKNASDTLPDIETISVHNLELIDSGDKNCKGTGNATGMSLEESPSPVKISADVDMVEPLETSRDIVNEEANVEHNLNETCDIEMKEDSLQNVKDSENVTSEIDSQIPENASHCNMEMLELNSAIDSPLEMLSGQCTVTNSDQNSKLPQSGVVKTESELVNFVGDKNIVKIEPTTLSNNS